MPSSPDPKHATVTPSEEGANRYEDRRDSRDRRSGEDRRKKQEPFEGPDRRNGKDRRKGERRTRKHRRIPIFAKLAIVSTFLMSLFICSISFIILWEQKQQFVSQLTDFGESLVRIAGSNAADKILGEEDLVLFQLAKNLAQNEQVLFAVITDHKKIIRAHSRMENLGLPYEPPEKAAVLEDAGPAGQHHADHARGNAQQNHAALGREDPLAMMQGHRGQRAEDDLGAVVQ